MKKCSPFFTFVLCLCSCFEATVKIVPIGTIDTFSETLYQANANLTHVGDICWLAVDSTNIVRGIIFEDQKPNSSVVRSYPKEGVEKAITVIWKRALVVEKEEK